MSISKSGAVIIEGHIQGLSNTRSLGELGIPVFVVDTKKCIAQHSKYCSKFFLSSNFIYDEFSDFLVDLAKKENLKNWVLIPSNDHAVYTISKHKKKLQQYYKILVPDYNILNHIYDKTNLISLALKENIPIPITYSFDNIDMARKSKLEYPVITKGRNGLSFYKAIGKKVLLAKNELALQKQLYSIKEKYELSQSFTQELIPSNGKNKTISFTAFCDKGEIKAHWTGVKLREHPVKFGTATFAKNDYIDDCLLQSKKLLYALKYTGVCEIEYLQDPRSLEYKLIELNPRTWLWVELAKASGVNYAKMIYDYANGNDLIINTPSSKKLYWINPVTDFVFSMVGILKLKINPITYFLSLFIRGKVNAFFRKGDMKPGWIYLKSIFTFYKNR